MISSFTPNEAWQPTSATEITLGSNMVASEHDAPVSESSEHWTSFLNEYSLLADTLEHRAEHFGTVIGGNVVPITAAYSLRRSFEDSFLVSQLEGYKISEVSLVNSYIGKNSDLLNFLQVISSRLLHSEFIDKVTLALYKDAEEGWEKLHIQANSNIDSIDDIINFEKLLFVELFVEGAPMFANRIIFSIV